MGRAPGGEPPAFTFTSRNTAYGEIPPGLEPRVKAAPLQSREPTTNPWNNHGSCDLNPIRFTCISSKDLPGSYRTRR